MGWILKEYKSSGSLADKTAPGRKPILLLDQLNFIDAKMEENDELTAIGKTSSDNLIDWLKFLSEVLNVVSQVIVTILNFRSPETAFQQNGYPSAHVNHQKTKAETLVDQMWTAILPDGSRD